jgi:hypothetical protein
LRPWIAAQQQLATTRFNLSGDLIERYRSLGGELN